MANTLKTRSEIPVELTWDLTPLYVNAQIWEDDFAKLPEFVNAFNAFKGKLADSATTLAQAYQASDALSRSIHKLWCHAHLRADEDAGDSERQAPQDRMRVRSAEISATTAWFDPELLALPQSTLDAYLFAPELSFYRRTIEQTLRGRPHTLSAAEESILSAASDVLGQSYQTFNALNNADIKFPSISDEHGQTVELTKGNYMRFMECPNREVRQNAFKSFYSSYEKVKNTLGSTLAGTVKNHLLQAKLRNFSSAREAALFPDNVPTAIYDQLIASIRSRLPVFHDYIELRRQVFKLDKLSSWDLAAPLVTGANPDIPWEQACSSVKAAMRPLGTQYCQDLEAAFSDRWIDVCESRGKRSGAYSSGCYDSPPYILLNYNQTLDEVFTLAHELGHSMHSFYSHKHQAYHYSHYCIFVAEVASTVNEMFLFRHLIDSTTDRDLRVNLLNQLADTIRGTIFRQTQFAEFERDIHAMAEAGKPLSPDLLSQHYFQMVKEYHGPAVELDPSVALEWCRVPHFHYNFYVYKYATGLSAAIALYQGIIDNPEKNLQPYLNFLQAGSTQDPLDLLKAAGIDLTTPAPVNAALDLFAQTVAQLRKELIAE